MKKIQPLLWLLLLVFVFTGCAGPKTLERKINRTAYEPIFFFETDVAHEKSDKTVSFEVLNESALPERSTVLKNDGNMLFLLLFMKYEYDMTLTLGENATNPSALQLVEQAIAGTFERSGNFKTAGSTAADYKGVVTIKEMDITCDLYKKGFAFWGIADYTSNAQNSVGNVKFNLKLYDNQGGIVFDKDYQEKQVMKYNSSSTRLHDVKNMAVKNMVENLTISSQNVAAAMTKDINKVILKTASITSTATEF